ncbi:Ribosomal-protein-alanine acetyltransferase [Beauveria bassiana]|nr:Ribosomal-protein-alanine acetyltransferase [Beauveria bassiana]KAH8711367.1 Ribosomal-protein-alanine acetyltransferase [Beauveria bassiana]
MDLRPASDFTIEQIARCSNEAFADYFGHPIVWTPEELAVYVPSHCISLERSLVACPEGSNTPVGFALMAYRDDLPGHARLAGMGVVPAWAGKGVGSRLLAAVLDAARASGIKTIWLEVITENAPAVKLYSRNGFQPVRSLAGWTKDAEPAAAAAVVEKPDDLTSEAQPALEEQTPQEVLRLLRQHGAAAAAAADLPWQLWHQFALATRPHACRGFKLGSAHCAISDPEHDKRSKESNTVGLLGVVVAPEEARGKGDATALLRAVMARYPGKKWKAPATIPLEYGETIARRLGFTMENIRMDLMKLSL